MEPRASAPHHIQNRSATPAPATASVEPSERITLMMGVPHVQLDALSEALAAGPVTLGTLHALLANGVAGTPLALVLADELADRCTLPTAMPEQEQKAWRTVLRHALRLPALEWEVAVVGERRHLAAHTARLHPLLKALRDALYRPHAVERAQWQAWLDVAHDLDSQALALDYQRQQMGNRDMQARADWARADLRVLAPDADGTALERALRRIRQQEQLERGLLEPRIGLQYLIEDAAAPPSALNPHSPLAQAAGAAVLLPMPADAPGALAALFCDAARAAVPVPNDKATPVGGYDSVAKALVSLLSLPMQLTDLRHWISHGLVAADSQMARALKPHVPGAAWSTPVQMEPCAPPHSSAADFNSPQQNIYRKIVDGLLGQPSAGQTPGSTALVSCVPQPRHVAGLQVQQAEQILQFMRRQQPEATTAPQAMQAFAHLFGMAAAANTMPPPETYAERETVDALSIARGSRPLARAGALTDEGHIVADVHAGSAFLPGAGAQIFGEVSGHVPLLLIQGLIDNIHASSWWSAIPGYTAHTAPGLWTSLHDLFALAGEPLHDRPPTPEALERFFGTAQGTALFNAIEKMPELSSWQQYEVERGGVEAQIYVFMRMIKQLMTVLPAHRHRDDTAGQQIHDEALYALARLGQVGGELLSQYDEKAPDAGRRYFQRIIDKTRPSAAHSPTPINAR